MYVYSKSKYHKLLVARFRVTLVVDLWFLPRMVATYKSNLLLSEGRWSGDSIVGGGGDT